MGKRKYPPITPAEVTSIVKALGFKHKRTEGGHAHYERQATGKYPRSIVTIDEKYGQFDDTLIKNMIGQSKHSPSREEFYGATKSTAKKAGVKLFQYVEVPTAPQTESAQQEPAK